MVRSRLRAVISACVPDEMKRPLLLVVGLCAFVCALGFGLLLVQYIGEGAGLQVFGLGVSSGSVLIGLVHVIGFAAGAFGCFALGAALCARALLRRHGRGPGSSLADISAHYRQHLPGGD
jgi:hypothetical protein